MTRKTRRLVSRRGSFVLGLSALGLVIFHVALLGRRLLDASITQPGVLIRWAAAALLVAGLLFARRRVRHAFLVFWLLMALLHVGIPAEQQLLDGSSRLAVVVQIGLTAACGVLLLLVIAAVADSALRRAPVDLTKIFLPRGPAFDTLYGRSPPAL